MDEHWLIDLVSLSELQIQLFHGLPVVRTVEQHDVIGAASGLKTCRTQAEIPDLQLVCDDVLAVLFSSASLHQRSVSGAEQSRSHACTLWPRRHPRAKKRPKTTASRFGGSPSTMARRGQINGIRFDKL